MKITEILSKQSPTKLAKAEKLDVRELEESDNKGNYVAYVDKGDESYDVNILIKMQLLYILVIAIRGILFVYISLLLFQLYLQKHILKPLRIKRFHLKRSMRVNNCC